MPRPTDAPLPNQYFQGGAKTNVDVGGLRTYLNELEARVNANMSAGDLPVAPSFTDTSRPDPTTVPVGTIIFNTDDGFINVGNGTAWTTAAGVVT